MPMTFQINLPVNMQKAQSKEVKKSSSFSLQHDVLANRLYKIKNKSSLDLSSKTHQTIQMVDHPTSELGSDPQSCSNNTMPQYSSREGKLNGQALSINV